MSTGHLKYPAAGLEPISSHFIYIDWNHLNLLTWTWHGTSFWSQQLCDKMWFRHSCSPLDELHHHHHHHHQVNLLMCPKPAELKTFFPQIHAYQLANLSMLTQLALWCCCTAVITELQLQFLSCCVTAAVNSRVSLWNEARLVSVPFFSSQSDLETKHANRHESPSVALRGPSSCSRVIIGSKM